MLPVEPVNKFHHPGQHPVAVVDDTVHIADKAFFLVKIDHKYTSYFRFPIHSHYSPDLGGFQAGVCNPLVKSLQILNES